MKKFTLEKIGSLGERLGAWELGGHAPISSPGLWLLTSTAGVPHLTPESLELADLQRHFSGLLIPFEKHARSVDVFEAFGKGFLAFSGLRKCPTLMTVLDPSLKMKSGYSTGNSISVWGESNQRQPVDNDLFLKGVKAIDPDSFVALCDADIPKDASGKKVNKLVKFNAESLNVCLDNNVGDKCVIAAIEGGYATKIREACAKALATVPVDGYLLDGFHSNGDSALDINIDHVVETLKEAVVPNISADKPRFFFGMCKPMTILTLVQNGVDFFDTSYVYHISELGLALTFNNLLDDEAAVTEEVPSKLEKNGAEEIGLLHVDLNNVQYKNDFGPLHKGCSCYACRKHSRGYVNHLLATKELLAGVLLVIHNLHHYGVFFHSIRKAIAEDRLGVLIENVK